MPRGVFNHRSRSAVERFWPKVNRSGPIVRDGLTPCWLWTGAVHSPRFPYGLLGAEPPKTTPLRAHCFSWELANGTSVPQGMCVCHRCDNPRCVNPDHLFIGTPNDNIKDALSKGRPIGKRQPKPFCRRGHALGVVGPCAECRRIGDRLRKRMRRRASGVPFRGNRISDEEE